MRKTILILFVAPLLLAALPHAAAQQQGQLTVHLAPLQEAITSEGPRSLPGTLELNADASAYSSAFIAVHLDVVRAPAWLVTSITPASTWFPVPNTPNLVYTSHVPFTLTLAVLPGAEWPGDVTHGTIEVRAVTTPTTGGSPIAGLVTTAIKAVHLDTDPCAEAEDDAVVAQSVASRPVEADGTTQVLAAGPAAAVVGAVAVARWPRRG